MGIKAGGVVVGVVGGCWSYLKISSFQYWVELFWCGHRSERAHRLRLASPTLPAESGMVSNQDGNISCFAVVYYGYGNLNRYYCVFISMAIITVHPESQWLKLILYTPYRTGVMMVQDFLPLRGWVNTRLLRYYITYSIIDLQSPQ